MIDKKYKTWKYIFFLFFCLFLHIVTDKNRPIFYGSYAKINPCFFRCTEIQVRIHQTSISWLKMGWCIKIVTHLHLFVHLVEVAWLLGCTLQHLAHSICEPIKIRQKIMQLIRTIRSHIIALNQKNQFVSSLKTLEPKDIIVLTTLKRITIW